MFEFSKPRRQGEMEGCMHVERDLEDMKAVKAFCTWIWKGVPGLGGGDWTQEWDWWSLDGGTESEGWISLLEAISLLLTSRKPHGGFSSLRPTCSPSEWATELPHLSLPSQRLVMPPSSTARSPHAVPVSVTKLCSVPSNSLPPHSVAQDASLVSCRVTLSP